MAALERTCASASDCASKSVAAQATGLRGLASLLGKEETPCWDLTKLVYAYLEQGDSCELGLVSRAVARAVRALPWPHASPARDAGKWRRALPRAQAFRAAPARLEPIGGAELSWLEGVPAVELSRLGAVGPATLAPLARATTLRVAATAQLAPGALLPLRAVRSLTLRSSPVDDAALAHLPPGLVHLDIGIDGPATGTRGQPRVTDWGVARLPASVVSLGLEGHAVTDRGLEALGRVRVLDVSRTLVAGGGLRHLAACRALRLRGVRLGAGHAAGLAAMPALRALDISAASIEAAEFPLPPALTHLDACGAAGLLVLFASLAAPAGGFCGLRELRLQRAQLARLWAPSPQGAVAEAVVGAAFAALGGLRRLDAGLCAWLTPRALLGLRDLEALDCAGAFAWDAPALDCLHELLRERLRGLTALACARPAAVPWETPAMFADPLVAKHNNY